MKLYKYKIISIIIAIAFFVLSITAFAHPGRTDSDGGHFDSSTGEYHYHHGFPAHQHDEEGNCPYEGQGKKYNYNSPEESYGKTETTTKKKHYKAKRSSHITDYISSDFLIILFVFIVIIGLFILLISHFV